MVEGDKWRSYEYGSQIHYSRKWISLDTVTTDWGEIECMKLQIQNNSNVISWPTIRQYFSNKGLIKEESFTKQTTLNGDTIFVSQETILKEVNF